MGKEEKEEERKEKGEREIFPPNVYTQ